MAEASLYTGLLVFFFAMWHRVGDSTVWNTGLYELPSPHVLQCWEWGDFKSRWGWSAQRWQWRGEDDQPRAMVQLLRRNASRLPLCVLYVPKGPVVADDKIAYQEALSWLERQAREQHAIWVKVDGDIGLTPSFSQEAGEGNRRAMLQSRGWQYSPNQVQFRNTLHTDLRHTDDELLAAMKPKWRYNIRLAEKHGVLVRQATRADEVTLYAMYAETGRRDGFIIREPRYYIDAWRTMSAVAFIAEQQNQPLAALILFRFADRAWYFYGMSRSEGREHMPNHLLQWTAIRWARDNGCTIYDWWGAPETLDEKDSMWGVYRFKEGFGAQLVEGLGAWDYAPVPWLYGLFVRWMPTLSRWMGRSRQPDQGVPVA